MKKITKIIIVTISSLLILLIISFALFKVSKSRSFQFFGELINKVETEEKVVALTFDDGPNEYTDSILELLEKEDVKATFFVVGKDLEENQEEGNKIIKNGHQLANHSYTHPRFLMKSYSFTKKEIDKTNEIIRKIGYSEEIVFRPPYGKKLFILPYYLSKNNIKTITWDIEPDTYFSGNTEKIVEYTVKNTKPGSIILLHPFCKKSCQSNRESITPIIEELKNKGYKFVTVNQLINQYSN